MGHESPAAWRFFMVENPRHIDILGACKDGGADLVMVSPDPLDETPEGQTLLLDKVETYLKYIRTPDFRGQCPAATPENTHVVLLVREEPSPFMQELLQKIAAWVADNHARFFVRIEKE